MAFKIASGYVDIEITYDRKKLLKDIRKAGADSAQAFNDGFRDSYNKTKNRVYDQVKKDSAESGRRAGRELADGMVGGWSRRMSDIEVGFSRTNDAVMLNAAQRTDMRRPAEVMSNNLVREFDRRGKKTSTGIWKSFRKHLANSPDLTYGMLYVLLGAVAAVLPFVGAALATGFTLIGGGAMAALGIAIAAKSPEVKKKFKDLTDDIKEDLKDFAVPFEETLLNTADYVRETWDAIAPSVERSMESMAPTLDSFFEDVFESLESWDEVIDIMTEAFNELLEAWGPILQGDLDDLKEALKEMFEVVAEDPEDFAKVLHFLVQTLIFVIELVTFLSETWVKMSEDLESGNSRIKGVFDGLVTIVGSLIAPIFILIDGASHLFESLEDLGSGNIKGALDNLGKAFGNLGRLILFPIEMVFMLVDGIMSIFVGEKWNGRLAKWWRGLWDGLGTHFVQLIAGFVQFNKRMLDLFVAFFAAGKDLFWAGVEVLLAPFTWFKNELTGSGELVPTMVREFLKFLGMIFIMGNPIITTGIRGFLRLFQGFRKDGTKEFSLLESGIGARLDGLRRTVDARLGVLRDAMRAKWKQIKSAGIDTIQDLVTGWGRGAGKFRTATRPGVSALVSQFNAGVIGLWNKFAPKLNLKKIEPVSTRGLAKGGVLPGYSRYTDGDSLLVPMRPGEGVYVSEAMKDPYERARLQAVNQAAMSGKSLAQFRDGRWGGPSPHYQGAYKDQKILDSSLGFARGGIIPEGVRKLLSPSVSWADHAGELGAAIRAPLNAITNSLAGNKSSSFLGVPWHIANALIPAVIKSMTSADKKAFQTSGGATGTAAKVLKKAGEFVGLGGRPNRFSNAMGMPFGPWCAAFVSEVFRMVNATGSINGITATNGGAAVATFNSKLRKVPFADRQPGDLPTYRGNGHINMLLNPRTGTTIGGNESDRVRVQNGYVNSATAILRPKWADQSKGMGSHDFGGMLPDRGIAYNRSGQFEVVQTLEQIKAIAALLESSQGTIVIENLIVEANKIDEVQKMLDMLNGVAANARKGGFGDYETEL